MTYLRSPLVPTLALLALAVAGSAQAACGDDVEGRRVACGCGDLVVSDTRLLPSDPVVSERCSGDGLLVRARPDASSIKLDLAGLTILGSGHGTGVYVIDGGSDGASIHGGDGAAAEIAGFGTGFRARGQRSVRELRNLSFVANERDGVVLRGAKTQIVGVKAERNGRDGMRIGGRGPRLDGVEAQQNARYGLRVTTPGLDLDKTVSAGNQRAHVRAGSRAKRNGAQD
jgi:hypothetical protein